MERIGELLQQTGHAGLRLVSTSLLGEDSSYGGIFEVTERIGAAAVDILAGYFYHGERGIPESPRTTRVDGIYRQV